MSSNDAQDPKKSSPDDPERQARTERIDRDVDKVGDIDRTVGVDDDVIQDRPTSTEASAAEIEATPPSAETASRDPALAGDPDATVSVTDPRSMATSEQSLDSTRSREPALGEEANQNSPSLRPGSHFGDYVIEGMLGQGAMGTVYRARDVSLDRPVALKIPKLGGTPSRETHERFIREAKAAAALQHPNICPVYRYGVEQGLHFLAMPLISGKPLSSYIKKGTPIPEHQAALLIRKLALALQVAHDQGVVHRDLKPANIMVNERKEPVVMDFGLAQREQAFDEKLTSTGMFVGTPAYSSPEQIRNLPGIVGPPTDIYGLGVILYEMLTGYRPFRDNDLMSLMTRVLRDKAPPPNEGNPNLSDEITAICLRAIEKEPQQRFASMKELAEAVTKYLKSKRQGKSNSSNGEKLHSQGSIPPTEDAEIEPVEVEQSKDLDLASLEFLQTMRPNSQASQVNTLPLAESNHVSSRKLPVKERGGNASKIIAGVFTSLMIVACLVAGIFLFRSEKGEIRLQLSEVPTDLQVRIDGSTIPLQSIQSGMQLTPGWHELEIQADEFTEERRWIEVEAEKTLVLEVVLQSNKSITPGSVASDELRPSSDDAKASAAREATDHVTAGAANLGGIETTELERKPPPTPKLVTGTKVFENFEQPRFDGWSSSGNAFGKQPLRVGSHPDMVPLMPWQSLMGNIATSNRNWHGTLTNPDAESELGKLISEPFLINYRYINFMLVAGNYPGQVEVRMRIGDKIVRRQTGFFTPIPLPVTWDVSDHVGQEAVIELVDDVEGKVMSHLTVDNIEFSDVDGTLAWQQEIQKQIDRESIEWNGHKYWFPKWVIPARQQVGRVFDDLEARIGANVVSVSSDEEHEFFMQHIHGDTWLGVRGDGAGRFETPEGKLINYNSHWIEGHPYDWGDSVVYCNERGDWFNNAPSDQQAFVAFEWGEDLIAPVILDRPEQQLEAAKGIINSVDKIILRTTDRYITVTKGGDLPEEPFEIIAIEFAPGYFMPATVRSKFRSLTSIRSLGFPNAKDITLSLVTDTPNLRRLKIVGPDCQGQVLAKIPDHNSLRLLNFDSVNFHRSVFRYFAGTRELRGLHFARMRVERSTILPFTNNENLTSFYMDATAGAPQLGLEFLSQFPRLQSISFYGSGVEDRMLEVMGALPELVDVQLGANPLSGEGLQYFASARRLRKLQLYQTNTDSDGLSYIPELPNLRLIELGKTRVSDLDPRLTDRLPYLEQLKLADTLVGDEDLPKLNHCRYLKNFDAQGSQVTDRAKRALSFARPALHVK